MPNPKWSVYGNKASGIDFDITDADAQSQLTAIKDGTTIDSFGDVETALSTKYDINDESQISILDYDYVPYYADAESATRKIYWTNIKNGLKGFFDDLYCAIGLVPSGASSSNKLATASDVADKVDWSSYAKTGSDNSLVYPYRETTKTSHKATFTDNGNGTITVVTDGATDADVTFLFHTENDAGMREYMKSLGKKWLLGGLSEDICLYISNYDGSNTAIDSGNGAEFTFTNQNTGFQIGLFIKSGTNISTPITIYPHISESKYSVYGPYAMTNRELTLKVVKSKDKAQVKLADLTWTQTSTGGYISSAITVGDDVNDIVSVIPYDYGGLLATTVVTPMVYSNNQFKLLANTDTFTQYQYFSYRVWYI